MYGAQGALCIPRLPFPPVFPSIAKIWYNMRRRALKLNEKAMRGTICAMVAALAALCGAAAEYTLDFDGASPRPARHPVLRRSVQTAAACGEALCGLAVGDTIHLKMFGDTRFQLEVVAAPPPGVAGRSFIARDAANGADAIVKATAQGGRISIDHGKALRQYTVRWRGGEAEVFERDNSSQRPGRCATCEHEDAAIAAPEAEAAAGTLSRSRLGASETDPDAFATAEQRSVIDILVAFDKGAKAWLAAGECPEADDILSFADYAVGKMNSVLANSRLDHLFFYRLVGVAEIDAGYSAINNSLLGALRERSGVFAPVHALRKKFGADIVTLLVDRTEGGTSGIGYGLESVAPDGIAGFGSSRLNCNVCDIKTVHSRYTMSHETGHNMGCGHSNRQGPSNSGPQSTQYSCGYHFTDANGIRRYTVMAYSYTEPYTGEYLPVPYFSTPEITPQDYGVPVGTAESNDNRRVLAATHGSVSQWQEHVKPYDWDVRFLDKDGRDCSDGEYSSGYRTLVLTNSNANASIYYTLDGSTPNRNSAHSEPGQAVRLTISGTKTVTACAVTNGVALSMRSITLFEGLSWSGEAGKGGCGVWTGGDSSVLAWDGASTYYLDGDTVAFHDIAGAASPVVTVKGRVSPGRVDFNAPLSHYRFAKGDDEALLALPGETISPGGSLAFDMPVRLDAKKLTLPPSCTFAFNAPFGTNVVADSAYAHCAGEIYLDAHTTLTVAPGAGRTQVFDHFNYTTDSYSTAHFRVGEGTVRFKGPFHKDGGLFGYTRLSVADGGHLVFDTTAATGTYVETPMSVEKGGRVTFNGSMEHMRRHLELSGGTVCTSNRLDRMHGKGIAATDDSLIEDGAGKGYLCIRYANETVDVADGKTLTLDIATREGPNTEGFGIVKKGGGEIVARKPLGHSGPTIVSNGVFTVAFSSANACGAGWTLARGATLNIAEGCSLAVPSLALAAGSRLSMAVGGSAAPLSVGGAVDVSGVAVSLAGTGSLAVGDSFPLLAASGAISGADAIDTNALPALGDGQVWKMSVAGGTLSACVAGTVTLQIPAGGRVNLADIGPEVVALSGEGTLVCDGALPHEGLGFTNAAWRGTVELRNLAANDATKDVRLELYGNAASRILLADCAINWLNNNDATFAGTLALEGTFSTSNGYSSNHNVFGALEGDGDMVFSSGQRQAYVFNTASNYTGSISIGAADNNGIASGRRIVFGAIASAAELPSAGESASVTLKAGATAAIGAGAAWTAYNGIDVAGTLLVKGAGARLACTAASPSIGLRIRDGATLRFDSADASLDFAQPPTFASGTATIAFAQGVRTREKRHRLISWSAKPGGAFVLADPDGWRLECADDGLWAARTQPSDSLSIGDGGAYIARDAALQEWMDFRGLADNREFDPDLTWQDFLQGKAVNGHPRWVCYILGLDKTWRKDDTLKANIAVQGGKVVVTTAENARAVEGVKLWTALFGGDEPAARLPFIKKVEGTSVEIPAAERGFYSVEVSFEAE